MERTSETALKVRQVLRQNFLASEMRQSKVSQENEATMSERQQKALAIAAKSKIAKKGDTWLVPSQSGNGHYKVNNTDPDWPTCTCMDFELRHARCKHIYAVEIVIEREQSVTETTD